ncbi:MULTISPECIES: DUF3429 domain-containing protein [Curvibacter]|jgi:hypothetical protein|uniref:DUF3429 domain-containing protein n=1 Tax=Curvibacter TaxID=281915 RepID=UPI000485BC03|nr:MULTISPECIES: DUF3429 domain-containing protein [Curvibacter]MBV5292079.1 DUF3429 domain-containing protein [Curvibacter lanceolatus]
MNTSVPTPHPAGAPLSLVIERLGYAGLAPFVLLALLMWLVTPDLMPFVALALMAYAATVASFLGGIHWGIAFQQGEAAPRIHLVWGVIPPIVAWIAVVMPIYAGLPLLGLLLVVCYLVDRKTWTSPQLRPWLTLRFRLTVVATLSCLLGAANT